MLKSRLRTRAHLALIVANIIFGINYTVAKAIMPDQIKPFALVSLRSLVTVILFWISGLFIPKETVSRKDLLYLFGCSFFGVVINQTLFLVGLNLTSPINSSIILSTNPIFAFIFAAFILKEKISLLKGTGLAIGFAGVLILILKNGTTGLSSSGFIGDIYTLINTISWAFYTVIIKRMLEKYHPVTVMKWTFFFGMFVVIPIGYNEWSTMVWSSVSLSSWLGIGFVVVGATFVGYLLISFGLRRLSPTIVSIYIYMQPVIAAYIATMIGQDNIDFPMVLSALMIFAGVFFVSWQRKAVSV